MHSKSCHVGSLWQSHTLKIINTPIDRCGGSTLGVFNIRGWIIQRKLFRPRLHQCHIHIFSKILLSVLETLIGSMPNDNSWCGDATGRPPRRTGGPVLRTNWVVFSVWKSSARQVARFLINPAGEQVRIQLRITLELG